MDFLIEQLNGTGTCGLALLFVLVACFLVQMFYYIYYYAAPLRHRNRQSAKQIIYTKQNPAVSIIVCAQNEADNLQQLLPILMEQDYPEYEVIVVNDGSTDESNEVLDRFLQKYKNLHVSFLPQKAKYISRKKMCLSIGIKAAKNELLLFTDADCQPAGKHWIEQMARNYVSGVDIVLGLSHFKPIGGFLGQMIDYDNLFNQMSFAGYAICGVPYRGAIRNLSYSKNTYYKAKGFTPHLALETGEDDIFVQDAATATNTRMEVSPEAHVVSNRKMNWKSFKLAKQQRLDNRKLYRWGIKFRLFTEVFTRLLFYAAIAALAVYSLVYANWATLLIAVAIFLVRYITQSIVMLKNRKMIGAQAHPFGQIAFDILLPAVSFHMNTVGRIGKKKWEMWRE